MIVGPPAAGKSTLASALVERRPSLRIISTDSIRHDLGLKVGNRKATDDAYSVLCDQLRESLAKTESCVLDATFFRRKYRRMVFAIVAKCAVRVVVLQLLVSVESIRRRIANRSTRKGVGGVSSVEAFDEVLANTEDIDEGELPQMAVLVRIDCTGRGSSMHAARTSLAADVLSLLQAGVTHSRKAETD